MEGLSEAQLAECKEAFRLFDKNNDGVISTKELATALRALGSNPTEGELLDMLREVDADGSGNIEFAEYVLLMGRSSKSNNDQEFELMQAFKMFDKDEDGLISASELMAVLVNLGEKMTMAQAEEMVREADTNGDGMINYEEYVKFMLR